MAYLNETELQKMFFTNYAANFKHLLHWQQVSIKAFPTNS